MRSDPSELTQPESDREPFPVQLHLSPLCTALQYKASGPPLLQYVLCAMLLKEYHGIAHEE